VGSTAGFALVERGLVDELALVDIAGDLARGEALDIFHGSSATGKRVKLEGSSDYSITADSDLVIVTAGIRRKPTQSRLDLVETNAGIMKDIVKNLKEHSGDSILFVVANPVDILTNVALRTSGFPKERVFGLGTLLDTIRLRSHMMEAFGERGKGIDAMIIGEHGDTMLPVFRGFEGTGISYQELEAVFNEVRDAAVRVIEMKGATFFAPAMAISMAVEAVARDTGEVMPLSVYQEEHDFCIGHPARVGRDGVRSVDFTLTDREQEAFGRSLETLRGILEKVL